MTTDPKKLGSPQGFIERIGPDGGTHRFPTALGWDDSRVDDKMRDQFGIVGTQNAPMGFPIPEGHGISEARFPAGWQEYQARNKIYNDYGVGRKFRNQMELEQLQLAKDGPIGRFEGSWKLDDLANEIEDGGQPTRRHEIRKLRQTAQADRDSAFDELSALAAFYPKRFGALMGGLTGEDYSVQEGPMESGSMGYHTSVSAEQGMQYLNRSMSLPYYERLRRLEGSVTLEQGETAQQFAERRKTTTPFGIKGHGLSPFFFNKSMKPGDVAYKDTLNKPMHLIGWRPDTASIEEAQGTQMIKRAPSELVKGAEADPVNGMVRLEQWYADQVPAFYDDAKKHRYLTRVVPLLARYDMTQGKLEGAGFTGHTFRPEEVYKAIRPEYAADLTNFQNERAYIDALDVAEPYIRRVYPEMLAEFGDPKSQEAWWNARDAYRRMLVGYAYSGRLNPRAIDFPVTLFKSLGEDTQLDMEMLTAGVAPAEMARTRDFFRAVAEAHANANDVPMGDLLDAESLQRGKLQAEGRTMWVHPETGQPVPKSYLEMYWKMPMMSRKYIGSGTHTMPDGSVVQGFHPRKIKLSAEQLREISQSDDPDSGRWIKDVTSLLPRGVGGIPGVGKAAEEVLDTLGVSDDYAGWITQMSEGLPLKELVKLRDLKYWSPQLPYERQLIGEGWGLSRGVVKAVSPLTHLAVGMGFAPEKWIRQGEESYIRAAEHHEMDRESRWRPIVDNSIAGGAAQFIENIATDTWDVFSGLWQIIANVTQLSSSQRLELQDVIEVQRLREMGTAVRPLTTGEQMASHVKARSEDWAEIADNLGAFLADMGGNPLDPLTGDSSIGRNFASRPVSTLLTFLDVARIVAKSPVGKVLAPLQRMRLNAAIKQGDIYATRMMFAPLVALQSVARRAKRYLGDKAEVGPEKKINIFTDEGVRGRAEVDRVFKEDADLVQAGLDNWAKTGSFDGVRDALSVVNDTHQNYLLPAIDKLIAERSGEKVRGPLEIAAAVDALAPDNPAGRPYVDIVADAMARDGMSENAALNAQATLGVESTLLDIMRGYTDRGRRRTGSYAEGNPSLWLDKNGNVTNNPITVATKALDEYGKGVENSNPAFLHVDPAIYARALLDAAESLYPKDSPIYIAFMKGVSDMVTEAAPLPGEGIGYHDWSSNTPAVIKAKQALLLYENRNYKLGNPAIENLTAEIGGGKTWAHPDIIEALHRFHDAHAKIIKELQAEGKLPAAEPALSIALGKDHIRLEIGGRLDAWHRNTHVKIDPSKPYEVNKLIRELHDEARPRQNDTGALRRRGFIDSTLTDWVARGLQVSEHVIVEILRRDPSLIDESVPTAVAEQAFARTEPVRVAEHMPASQIWSDAFQTGRAAPERHIAGPDVSYVKMKPTPIEGEQVSGVPAKIRLAAGEGALSVPDRVRAAAGDAPMTTPEATIKRKAARFITEEEIGILQQIFGEEKGYPRVPTEFFERPTVEGMNWKSLRDYIDGRRAIPENPTEAQLQVRKNYSGHDKVVKSLFLPKEYKGKPMSRERWDAMSTKEKHRMRRLSAPLKADALRSFIELAEEGRAAEWSPPENSLMLRPKRRPGKTPKIPKALRELASEDAIAVDMEGVGELPPAEAAAVESVRKALEPTPEGLVSEAAGVKAGYEMVHVIPERPDLLAKSLEIDRAALSERAHSIWATQGDMNLIDAAAIAGEWTDAIAAKVTKERQRKHGQEVLLRHSNGWDFDAGTTMAEQQFLSVLREGGNPNTLPAWLSMEPKEFRALINKTGAPAHIIDDVMRRMEDMGEITGDNAGGARKWFGLDDEGTIAGTGDLMGGGAPDIRVRGFSKAAARVFHEQLSFMDAIANQKNFFWKLATAFKAARSARQLSTLANNVLNNFSLKWIIDGDFMAPLRVWKWNTIYQAFQKGPANVTKRSERAAMRGVHDSGAVKTDFNTAELSVWNQALAETMTEAVYKKVAQRQLEDSITPGLVQKIANTTLYGMWQATKHVLSKPGNLIKKIYGASDNIMKVSDIAQASLDMQPLWERIKPGEAVAFRVSEMRWATAERLPISESNMGGLQWNIDGVNKTIKRGDLPFDPDLNLLAAKEGALRANRKYFDYTDLSPWQMTLRKHGIDQFLSPYFTWTYKSIWVPGIKRGWMREMLTGHKEIRTNSEGLKKHLDVIDVKRLVRRQIAFHTLRNAGTDEDRSTMLNRMLSFRIDQGMPMQLRWMAPGLMSVDSLAGQDPSGPQRAANRLALKGAVAALSIFGDFVVGPQPDKDHPMMVGRVDENIQEIRKRLGKARVHLERYSPQDRQRMFNTTAKSISFKKLGIVKKLSDADIIALRQRLRDVFPGNPSDFMDFIITFGMEKGMTMDVINTWGEHAGVGTWRQIRPPEDWRAAVRRFMPYIAGGGTVSGAADVLIGIADEESLFSSRHYSIPEKGQRQESLAHSATRAITGFGGYYRDLGLTPDGSFKRDTNGEPWKGGWLLSRMLRLRDEWAQAAKGTSRVEREIVRKKDLPSVRARLIQNAITTAGAHVETSLMQDELERETRSLVTDLRKRARALGYIPPKRSADISIPRVGPVGPGLRSPKIGPKRLR